MIWYYKRLSREHDKKTVIVCNTWMLYMRNIIACIGIGACFFNQIFVAAISLLLLVFLLFRFIVKEGDIIAEIKAQNGKNADRISYSGNKYSFSTPLYIMIENKKNQAQ